MILLATSIHSFNNNINNNINNNVNNNINNNINNDGQYNNVCVAPFIRKLAKHNIQPLPCITMIE